MGEIKGSLLGIILAVAVFGIVFSIITLAVKKNSETVTTRMSDSVEIEPVFPEDTKMFTLHY